MDVTVWVERLAHPGETVRGDRLMFHPGGKSANQAVAAARADASVALIGRVGSDVFGAELLAGFQRDGVDASCVTRDDQAPTGVALIGVDTAGQNTITVGAGANGRVSLDDLDRASEIFASAKFGLINFEIAMPVVVEAARRFRAAGACVVLNLSPIYALPTELLDLVDLLIVNEIEAASVVGDSNSSLEQLERLCALGIPKAVITLGPDGAVFTYGVRSRAVGGYSVTSVDPTAAGDAFLGTLVASLQSGVSMFDGCCRANAAGALAVSRAGAQPSIPTRAEVEAALAEWGGVNV